MGKMETLSPGNNSLSALQSPDDYIKEYVNLSPPEAEVLRVLIPVLNPEGYDVVATVIHLHPPKKLQIFIDRTENKTGDLGLIGIQDCVKVNHLLDQPLETCPEIDAIFKGPYELEVSSPGLERPLSRIRDFTLYTGEKTRIHTTRPLSAEEIQNEPYAKKNPKQKNFLGLLQGVENGSIRITIPLAGFTAPEKGRKKAKPGKPAPSEEIRIPIQLIAQAQLEL